ncbi:MAG: hypothetical protein JNN24_06770 [Hyphomicrobium zavarzinii]|uniref:hypothetical protein n=1 Tax=Hyphomicrobium zavarzinii TaxID=48292 RepID=UPI001A4608B5|nr:hypothetical protein [Hyphomicrobium zavarzinii]MBL8845458.1 hypothetical protein [Hyphomicrobium zavarzinii]
MPREEFNKRIGYEPPPQPKGAFDMANDVAKSAGIGVAQGAIALATLPGNLEQLGRMGINAVGNLAGAEGNVVDPETLLPNYGGVKRGIEQKFTGEFYQPQTTAGEYARTIGEFAPAAIGGGLSLLSRAARVAAPAVVSETAGQLTEGTALEPWARVGGALVAGHVTNAGQRAITPLPTDPVRQQAVQALEREGVTALTAGQRTGRRPLQWTESTLSDIPFAGRRANAIQSQQAEQYTRAALRRIGINADRADPPTMATAYRQIGDRFNTVAGRNNLVPTRFFMNRLQTIGDDYRNVTAEPLRAPIVDEVITALRDPSIRQNNVIPGRLYQNYRSGLGRAAQGIQSRDPVAAGAIRDIIDVLDRTMETSIRAFQGNNAADLGAFRQARNQYRHYLAIEEAVSRAGPGVEGIITPAALRSALKRQGKRAYVHGRGDLNELARAGDLVMRPLPQSGTTPRAVAAGLIGGLSLTDPTFITSAVAPVVSGRVLMSEPVQRYLANQAINPAANALPQLNAPSRGALALPGAMKEEQASGR